MAKTAKDRKVAAISNYVENIDNNGEFKLQYKYKGKDIRQDLIVNPPCLIFVDPTTGNFNTVSVDIPKDWEFVKFIDEVN